MASATSTSPSPLDRLYGKGSSDELAGLFKADDFAETKIAAKGVRVEAAWANGGRAKLDCYPKVVRWLGLRSGEGKPTGLYSRLCKTVPDWLAAKGVERMVAVPVDKDSRKVLMKRGQWQEADGGTIEWQL